MIDPAAISSSHAPGRILTHNAPDYRGKARSLLILAGAEVMALALWFSATAIVPALKQEYGLSSFQASAYTSAVQIGFVFGTLASALLGLADRLDPRRFFAGAAVLAACANGLILVVPPESWAVPGLRFVTGLCMAGIYPIGMKLAATWARPGKGGDMGLLVGLLVGALTLGSASPHLFNALGGVDWRFTIAATSVAALGAAALILLSRVGPNRGAPRRFEPHFAFAAWKSPSLRLANLGYLGHQWELYAFWAWIAVFLEASFAASAGTSLAQAAQWAKLGAFFTIGIGAIGCLGGGWLADRIGRTRLTMAAMGLSGACAVLSGVAFGSAPGLVMVLCLVWGIAVIADSAQFSASIAELAEAGLVGTMLTIQTCAGFLLTLITIHLVPVLVEHLGWQWAFPSLAIGPFLGVWAMARLRAHPDARKLAGGLG